MGVNRFEEGNHLPNAARVNGMVMMKNKMAPPIIMRIPRTKGTGESLSFRGRFWLSVVMVKSSIPTKKMTKGVEQRKFARIVAMPLPVFPM